MKKVAYIILILLPITIFSQNKWELTHYIYDQHPKSIEVLDSNYINIFFSTGANDKLIYNSTNQGKTWKLIYATNIYIDDYGMSCPDSNSFFLNFSKGTIFKSVNNGKDVEKIYLDTNHIYQIKHLKMQNRDIGVACNLSLLVTKDGWKTYNYENYWQQNDSISFTFSLPQFKNDSIINCIVGNSRGIQGTFFCEFNINTYEYEMYRVGTGIGTDDMFIIDNKYVYTCGRSDRMSGGSCHDAIFKSSDSGRSWRRVLDLYYDNRFDDNSRNPFSLQSIAFKDSLTGIAVGQFGKIVYTYDGGESWIYESKLHDSIYQPPTMKVRYAGSVPIIANFDGEIYRMVEDNLAPKPEDTITISGRVWEGKKGQQGIPISIGYRVTMTDSNGYYKFTRLPRGNHQVKAINKYFDGPKHDMGYKPFDYTPVQYDLDLTSDTSGIDFNAIDLRTFYSVSGEIVTSGGQGLKDIPLTIGDSSTISTEDGKFIFPKIEQKRTYELIPYSKEYKFTPWAYSINIDKDIDTFRFVAIPITSVEENPDNNLLIKDNCRLLTYLNEESMNCIFDSDVSSNNFSISIFSITGELLIKENINVVKGLNEFTINLKNINSGIYLIQAELNGICSKTDKLIIVK